MKCTIEFLYASCLLLGSVTFGYIIGYPSPGIASMKHDPDFEGVDDDQYTLFNAISSLLATVGPFFCAFMLRYTGRKPVTSIFAGMCSVFYLMLYFTKGWYFWYGILCRALLGFALGGFSSIIPMYIVELAPEDSSGFFGSLHQFGIAIGLVIVYLVGDVANWKITSIVGMIITILLAILVWFIPESPAANKKDDTADYVKESLFQKKYFARLGQSIMMMVFQQFCGINAILTNLATLFEHSGVQGLSPNQASALSSSAMVISVLFGGILVERAGRKIAWSVSFGGISFSLLLYALTDKKKFGDDKANSICAIVFIFLFLLAYGLGAGAIPWFIISEIFPSSVRPAAVSLVSTSNWILAFIVIEIYPYMNKSMTEFGCILLFMFFSIGSTIFGAIFVKKNMQADTEQRRALKENLI